MNTDTAKILCKLNTDFYRKQSASFSETRQAPWPGWGTCLEVLRGELSDGLSVFDLACGNLRFEAFLSAALPETSLSLYAVDNCDGLVPPQPAVRYQSLDVAEELLSGVNLAGRFEAPLCDLSVSFGFLHHIPKREFREEVLAKLIGQTRPGGHVAISLWQFMKNPAMAEKARETHARALADLTLPALDEDDYLIGWKNLPGVYRYCHSFSEAEIDGLVESAAGRADVVSRFTADGRTGDLNTYLVLKVRP